jgi:hypothetical protein
MMMRCTENQAIEAIRGTQSEIRFWEKVDKNSASEFGCWQWTACTSEKGYGIFGISGRTFKAHRIAYVLSGGRISEGLCLLHSCDTPRCVNPSHLSPGTREENNRDMLIKGRHRPGDREAGMSYSQLGLKYGINISAAYKICKRILWK